MNAAKFCLAITLLSVNFFVVTSLKCYFCSYFEFKNGTKAPAHRVWDNYKVTPFCHDFHPTTFNTVDSIEGGCCSSRKMEVIDELTNETMWLSEHSTAAHIDNSRWNFTCSPKIGNYECRREKMFISHHSHNYIDESGKVCHCNTDLCNVAISDHNDNNDATTPLKYNAALIALSFIAIQLFVIKHNLE